MIEKLEEPESREPRIVIPGQRPAGPRWGLRQERLADLWDEILKLAKRNHAETGLEASDFDPDKDRYLALEALKNSPVRLYTLRAMDSKALLGYGLYFVNASFHNRRELWALQDALYVSPEHRGKTAVKFIWAMDTALRAEGVKKVLRQVSRRLEYGRTLLRMGYVEREVGYVRDLHERQLIKPGGLRLVGRDE